MTILASANSPADAQTAKQQKAHKNAVEVNVTDDEIVVSAQRVRGSAITDTPPIAVLDPDDIKSFGAESIEDLLEELSPQISSSRGRSDGGRIILVNGKRTASIRDILRYPPEAIRKIEIFPEDVALQYGYRPTQKVVNIILAENYTGMSGKLGYGQPSGGGFSKNNAEATLTKITKESRVNLGLTFTRSTALTEAERGIVQDSDNLPFALQGNIGPSPYQQGAEIDPALSILAGSKVTLAGVPQVNQPTLIDFAQPGNQQQFTDIGRYRSILPASDELKLNASYNRKIFGDIELTLTGTLQTKESEALLGLQSAQLNVPTHNPFSPFSRDVSLFRYFNPSSPLLRSSSSEQGQFALQLGGKTAGWVWNFTTNYSRAVSRTTTNLNPDSNTLQLGINQSDPLTAINPFSQTLQHKRSTNSASRNVNKTFSSKFFAIGYLAELPAGPIMASINAAFSHNASDSLSSFAGSMRTVKLTRDQFNTGMNISVPLANKNADVLPALGRLNLNGDFEYRKISNFRGILKSNFGLSWAPVRPLTLLASATIDSQAPTVQQLAGTTIITPNVTVFDFLRNENVLVNVLTGNNPNLRTAQRRDINLRLLYRPAFVKGLRFELGFSQNRNVNNVASFPILTPEIERAFPDRVFRNSSGQLISIDRRPVNFDNITKRQVEWGFYFSKRIKAKAPKSPSASSKQRSMMLPFGRKPGQNGRWSLSATHKIILANEINIRPGLPKLDLLNGSATGSGGTARHQVKVNGRWFNNGFGTRIAASYKSATRIENRTPNGSLSSGLNFSDLLTINLRMFVNFEQRPSLVKSMPFLKRSRLTLSIDNVFGAIQNVNDITGATPLRYQPGRLDTRGRFVSISFRKQF